jgi:hypothetical protein
MPPALPRVPYRLGPKRAVRLMGLLFGGVLATVGAYQLAESRAEAALLDVAVPATQVASRADGEREFMAVSAADPVREDAVDTAIAGVGRIHSQQRGMLGVFALMAAGVVGFWSLSGLRGPRAGRPIALDPRASH